MKEPYERLAYWLDRHLYPTKEIAEMLGCPARAAREKLKGRSPLLVSDLMAIAVKTRMTTEQLNWILKGEGE